MNYHYFSIFNKLNPRQDVNHILTTQLPYILFFFILAGNKDKHIILNGLEICKIRPGTYELAALERLEKSL